MEDTPSNYNYANQRFDFEDIDLKAKKRNRRNKIPEEESEQSDYEFGDFGGKKKKGKKKKKRQFQKVTMMVEPGKKEKSMAKAYGG